MRGYRNLDSALGDNVETWCNFGSFIGFTGQSGETDYAAANDFLITAAQAAATRARKEVTIGWGLWREVGIGTDRSTDPLLEKSKYTPMSSAEGVYHFLREVLDPAATRRSCSSGPQSQSPSKTIGPDTSRQARRRHPVRNTVSRRQPRARRFHAGSTNRRYTVTD